MSATPEDGREIPYRERSIPEILLLAQSYFGKAAVAYGLEVDKEPTKLEDYATGAATPGQLDDKRLRDMAEIISIHEDREMTPLDSAAVMINRKKDLDNMVPWDVIRLGESEKVVEAMPAILENYHYGNSG